MWQIKNKKVLVKLMPSSTNPTVCVGSCLVQVVSGMCKETRVLLARERERVCVSLAQE